MSFGGVWENFVSNLKTGDSRRRTLTYRTEPKSTAFRRKLNTFRPQPSTYRVLIPVVIICTRVSHYFTYPVNLIPMIRTWKERLEIDELCHNGPQCPHVHRIRVVFAHEKDLWCTIPSSGYVFGVRGFAFGLAGQAKISKFDDRNNILLFRCIWGGNGRYGDVIVQAYGCDEYVLWLHVTMKIASGVDVIETRNNLAKDVTYKAASECATLASLYEVKEIALHRLEDEVELPSIGKKKKVI